MKKIITMVFGSFCYGTNTPFSDRDMKGIFIPEAKNILLGRGKETISEKRLKNPGEKNISEDIDIEYFSLKQYFKLLAEGQTVALDMLFVPSKFWNLQNCEWKIWDHIRYNREKFFTCKSAAFVGYCRQQAKKYGIKGSRVAAVREVLEFLHHFPDIHQKLGVAKDIIEKFAINKPFISVIEIPQSNGVPIKFLEVCDRKLSFTASIKSAIEVTQHLMDEYGARALMAENNEGVDWKAVSHACRIGEEAIEFFMTGNITFPRPNCQELLRIKKGEVPYLDVAGRIEDLFDEVEYAAAHSGYPDEVDHEWIDNLLLDVYNDEVKITYGARNFIL